ncbi:MAG: hypothetical protein Kow0063_09700 [Anaerolineae bacterium]
MRGADVVPARALRIFLVPGVSLVLLVTLLSIVPVRAQGPLPNGVATGDTTSTSAILWARGTTSGVVLFEYSTDPTFSANVLTATAMVGDITQPVKVEITGLSPATTYFYRVTDASDASGSGHFRTSSPVGAHTGLRFGVSGDWRGSLAPYPSISNADERDLDFFVEHGDTISAGGVTSAEQYRLKHEEVYASHLGLNTWADLRASTSILATIDDNDVQDNFAGGAHPASDPAFDNTGDFINETVRYGNALAAFQAYNPLRDEYYGDTGDPRTTGKRRLYRFNAYASDAAVFILDTRSFRDRQLPLDDPTDPSQVVTFLTHSLTDSSRTMLGAQQLADLKSDLQQAQADDITWKFVLVSGAIQNLGIFHAPDRYEGYAAERTDLLRFINQNGINNVVFIAAGLHGTVVNNLTYQEVPFGPQIPTSAFEVIVGPVAITPTYGLATVNLAEAFGLITPTQRAAYDASSRAEKDEFIRQFMDDVLLTPLGYDPVGLEGSGIAASLLQGGYVAAHTYGWTEFEVDGVTQVLTVTTYGVEPYSEDDLATNPGHVITRTPAIVSQFVVTPSRVSTPVESVELTGPSTGTISATHVFTAAVAPLVASMPVTYVWQASDQQVLTHTGYLSDTTGFAWTIAGSKTITVTAYNGGSPVSATHAITISAGLTRRESIYLPLILRACEACGEN